MDSAMGSSRALIVPLYPRDASRHGVGDRPSNSLLPKKAAKRLPPGAFFRRPGRYKASKRHCESRAMRFLAKSHRASSLVLPRDGISPVAVAGWAVARVIAEAGE